MLEEPGFESRQWQNSLPIVQTGYGPNPVPLNRDAEPSFLEGETARA
jgi:hypothetical protein